jgi:IPT/TIG domain
MPPTRPGIGPAVGPAKRLRSIPPFDTSPHISSISPTSSRGSGGGTITIIGENFALSPNGSPPLVTIGGIPATGVVIVDSRTLTATIPVSANAGLFDVVVTQGSQSRTFASAFTYYTSTLVSVSPAYGTFGGGAAVTLFGYNFVDGSTIFFGGTAATGVAFIDSQHYAAITPAHEVGFVDVEIHEPGGNIVTLTHGFQFTLFTRGQDFRRLPGIRVSTALGQLKKASITIDGRSSQPRTSERIEVIDTLDNNRLLFAGVVETSDILYTDDPKAYYWQVTASGWASLFNKYRPIISYTNVRANDVVVDLVSRYAPGFTTNHVQTNLAFITVSFDGQQELYTCLQQCAKMIGGGHTWIDDYQDVHFMHVIPPNIPIPTQPQLPMMVGPAAAPVVAEEVGGPADSYTLGYYAGAVSFVYEGGAETLLGAFSPFFTALGNKRWSWTSIPLGPVVNGKNCIARRLYYKGYSTVGETAIRPYVEIPNNTATTFVGHGLSVYQTDVTGGVSSVAPPGAGTLEGAGVQIPAGFNIGDTINFKFTANGLGGGETTLGAGVSFTFTTAIGPRVVFPTALPTGASSLNAYVSDDGGVTYYRVATGYYPYFAMVFVTSRSILHTLPLAPTSNTAVTGIGGILTPSWAFPGTPYIAPPHGPAEAPLVSQGVGTLFPGSNTFLWWPPNPPFVGPNISSYTFSFTSGYYRLSYAYVYANGVMSLRSPDSLPVNMDGRHPFAVSNIQPGPSIDGVPVRGIEFFAVYTQTDAAPSTKDSAASLSWFEPGNSRTAFETQSGVGAAIKPPTNTANSDQLVWPNPDGPSLEEDTPVEPLDDSNVTLLREGAGTGISLSEDRTQLWNRIRVFGPGSTLTTDLLVGASVAAVSDLSQFNVRGGQIIAKGQVLSYFGVTAPTGEGNLFLSATTPVTTLIPSGSAIINFYEVNDVESQKEIGSRERDRNGKATDGVYETIVNDTTLITPLQIYLKAYGMLERYGWPVRAIRYSTRDPLTRPGVIVSVNLSYPPIKGDFLIQSVEIDQIRDAGDAIAPRYTVMASSVKFELDDFLLMILDNQAQSQIGSTPSVAGIADAAVGAAVSQTASYVFQVELTITDAQFRQAGTTPVTLVTGLAGKVIVPIVWTFEQLLDPGGTASAPNFFLHYKGTSVNLTGSSITNAGSFYRMQSFTGLISTAAGPIAANSLAGIDLQFQTSATFSGGNTSKYRISLTYYLMTALS